MSRIETALYGLTAALSGGILIARAINGWKEWTA